MLSALKLRSEVGCILITNYSESCGEIWNGCIPLYVWWNMTRICLMVLIKSHAITSLLEGVMVTYAVFANFGLAMVLGL